MKIPFLLVVATFFTVTAYARPFSAQASISASSHELNLDKTSSASPLPMETEEATPAAESIDLFGQDKPRKAKKGESQDQPKNGKQEVKEVATARRQDKPRKVSADKADLEVTRPRASAARPQSAARPVRGAAGNAVKASGNAAKAMKAAKPVKVNAGRIKVGKN